MFYTTAIASTTLLPHYQPLNPLIISTLCSGTTISRQWDFFAIRRLGYRHSQFKDMVKQNGIDERSFSEKTSALIPGCSGLSSLLMNMLPAAKSLALEFFHSPKGPALCRRRGWNDATNNTLQPLVWWYSSSKAQTGYKHRRVGQRSVLGVPVILRYTAIQQVRRSNRQTKR